MRILSVITICLLLIKLFSSCTFQNEEEYFGLQECDTIEVYYEDLTYIFTGICLSCHNSQETQYPGIFMDSYENVKTTINTGKVLPAIKHEGRVNMPYNQAKLADCEIQKIAIWIENGMPEKKN